MSGGHFDYDQDRIGYIAESIEDLIENNRMPVKKEDRWGDWDDREFGHDYPDAAIEKFKEGVKILKMAQIYAQRIDWYVSGDDGDESFLERLSEELETLNRSYETK